MIIPEKDSPLYELTLKVNRYNYLLKHATDQAEESMKDALIAECQSLGLGYHVDAESGQISIEKPIERGQSHV